MNRMQTLAAAALLGAAALTAVADDWQQWGGPNHDFTLADRSLAESWPKDGPKKLWSERLGDGNSAILFADGALYTMYRRGRSEFVVAKNPADGETIWEYKYEAPTWDGFFKDFGEGPNTTPLYHDGKLYTVGIRGMIHCFDAKTGNILWTKDLWEDAGHRPVVFGYCPSPLKYKDTMILPVGGEKPGNGIMAIKLDDGTVAWAKHDYEAACASPVLIDLDGQTQCVAFMKKQLIGFNPDNGDLYWEHPHETEHDINASTPVFDPESNTIFCSSAYGTGSRAVKLTRSGDTTTPEELWYSNKIQVHHGNAILVGDTVYASDGSFGAKFITAVDLATGKIKNRVRDFDKANFIKVDDKLIILDEKGQLALAKVTPDNLEVLAKATISDKLCRTVPTLVGTTLYLRDAKKIYAFDLK